MKSNQRLLAFLAICLCLVTALVGAYSYVSTMREHLRDQAINNIMMMTQQQEQAFSNFVTLDQERIHSLAESVASCRSTDTAALSRRVGDYNKVGAIYSIIDTSTGAWYVNKASEPGRLTGETLEEYRALTGSGVREPFIGPYTGVPTFGYYECFRFEDGVKGVFLKGYQITQVSAEFSLSFYNDQGFAFVVTRAGDIVLRSVGSEETYTFENIFESIDSTEANQESRSRFIGAVNARETGVEIFNDDGVDYVYTYVPISAGDDWYMISIIPLAVIMQEADAIISNTQVMFFVALMILTIVVGSVFFLWQYHRNIEKKNLEIDYKEQQINMLSDFLSRNTDDVYIMMDKDNFQVEFVSPNIERVLGFRQKDVEKTIRALGRAAYKSKESVEFDDLRKMTLNSSVGPMEAERPNPVTGEDKWYRETLYDVQLQNQEKIIVYISDRTAEQQIQDTLTESLGAVQVANRAKSAFLSSMSHDIRTPMNAIMGLLTLLQEDARDPEKVLEYAHRMEGASRHLLELINNVLDMNKIESGNVTLTISELDMPDLIENINTIIRPQAKARNQEFKLLACCLTSEHLLGDSTRISQILINLLSNAVKYTQDGGTIELTVRELPQMLNNYSHIQFEVKDNGRGMSEEFQKEIFDPFTREQNTLTNKIQGTGLGMAITKSLVELMGGSITVESKLGEGTTFVVDLELRRQDKPTVGKSFWEDHAITRMIVADDDPIAREGVIHAMGNSGVEVHQAGDGEEAVQMIREARERGAPYDLILLDWQMPKLDGVETARLIRKNYHKKVPILFFTGYDWSDIEEEAKEIGISHFLPKPFFMSTFRQAINKVMRDRRHAEVQEEKKKSVLEGKHILVAEDIEVNRLILGKILGTYHATCEMAENGRIVVEKFAASRPGEYDMIFMDVQMPEMNGYDATRAIRASSHPEAGTIPIIAMTANAFADDVREALESGMDAHVSKPIVMEQLEKSIRKVLEAKAAAKEQ